MRGLSLRARVLAGMAAVAIVLLVAAVVVTATTRAHLVDQVDDRLAAAARPERDDLGPRPPPTGRSRRAPGRRLRGGDRPGRRAGHDLRAQRQWAELAVPEIDAEQAAEAAATREPFTAGAVADPDLRYRVLARTGSDGLVHVTALPLTDVDDTISRLVTFEVIATLIALGVLAAVTWWVIRLGIRPIKQMTRTATEIAGGDLSHRVPQMAPSTEAGQLGGALNVMLETLEQAFDERTESQERLRRFVADASHELRTPVTTIRGYAELYRVGGLDEPSEMTEAMRRTEQEAVRMARLIDDLLALAKFDEGRPLERHPVDVTALVGDAARDARAVDPARPVTATLDGPIIVSGDEDRLRQVIANVVGNALVHTPRDAAVELAAATVDGDGPDHGDGPRPGHGTRGRRPGDRALLPGRQGAHPGSGRERAGDGDRRRRRHRPRGHDHGRQHDRRGHHGDRVPAARPLSRPVLREFPADPPPAVRSTPFAGCSNQPTPKEDSL